MITSTDAVVLKSMKYGETSRIVTIFSEQFGKIGLIAKGARGNKSKFGAALEPMSHSHIVLYKKESRDLQLLSQADLIRQFKNIVDDPAKVMVGFALLEYVDRAFHGEEGHQDIFHHLLGSLSNLDIPETDARTILLSFLIGLAEMLGFALDFESCRNCRRSFVEAEITSGLMVFESESGAFYCRDCSSRLGGARIAGEVFAALKKLHDEAELAGSLWSGPETGFRSAVKALNRHLASHVADMRPVKSLSMMEIFS